MIGFGREYRLKKLASYCFGRTLDVGCGTGNPHLPSGTIGFDKFKYKLPENYSKLVIGEVTSITSFFQKKSFDSIYASELIEHLHNPVKFIDDCSVLLKKNGRLVLSTDNPYRIQTLFGNVFLRKGSRSVKDTYAVHDYGHVNFFLPRMLNCIAAEDGLEVEDVFCVEGLPLPFLEQKTGYVYRNTERKVVAKAVFDHRNKSAEQVYGWKQAVIRSSLVYMISYHGFVNAVFYRLSN